MYTTKITLRDHCRRDGEIFEINFLDPITKELERKLVTRKHVEFITMDIRTAINSILIDEIEELHIVKHK